MVIVCGCKGSRWRIGCTVVDAAAMYAILHCNMQQVRWVSCELGSSGFE